MLTAPTIVNPNASYVLSLDDRKMRYLCFVRNPETLSVHMLLRLRGLVTFNLPYLFNSLVLSAG